jgi:hypothetical protein
MTRALEEMFSTYPNTCAAAGAEGMAVATGILVAVGIGAWLKAAVATSPKSRA